GKLEDIEREFLALSNSWDHVPWASKARHRTTEQRREVLAFKRYVLGHCHRKSVPWTFWTDTVFTSGGLERVKRGLEVSLAACCSEESIRHPLDLGVNLLSFQNRTGDFAL